mmetsp:Transcript_4846/g.5014  ORF Transcript_4846/g.5014 Transcript_4846/m.5014 type:complete len:181 (+) Transcript_4846:1-543(+)
MNKTQKEMSNFVFDVYSHKQFKKSGNAEEQAKRNYQEILSLQRRNKNTVKALHRIKENCNLVLQGTKKSNDSEKIQCKYTPSSVLPSLSEHINYKRPDIHSQRLNTDFSAAMKIDPEVMSRENKDYLLDYKESRDNDFCLTEKMSQKGQKKGTSLANYRVVLRRVLPKLYDEKRSYSKVK